MADAVWRGNEAELMRRLARLPLLLGPQGGEQARRLARALGVEALSIIKEAFIEKGRGGSDQAGIKWEPLSARYVAYGRRHKGLTRKRTAAGKKGRSGRPLLTDAQDRLWRGVYASCLRRGDDSATAARKAWGVVKRAGGKTIIGTYGGAAVEIGRDTGRLLASLSPGANENVLIAQPGSVRVGTNVKYAPFFHAKRPMWPADPERFPQAWKDRLAGIVEQYVRNSLGRMLGGG